MTRHSREDRHIVWADAEPLTRGVVAAFSGRVGPNSGELNEIAFAASLSEAFLDIGADDVRIQLGRVGLYAVRAQIIQEFQRPGAIAIVDGVIANLNGFAGNNPARGPYWAHAERDLITSGTHEDASGVLEDMSGIVAQYIRT